MKCFSFTAYRATFLGLFSPLVFSRKPVLFRPLVVASEKAVKRKFLEQRRHRKHIKIGEGVEKNIQGSISPTRLHEAYTRADPKAPKDSQVTSVFLRF